MEAGQKYPLEAFKEGGKTAEAKILQFTKKIQESSEGHKKVLVKEIFPKNEDEASRRYKAADKTLRSPDFGLQEYLPLSVFASEKSEEGNDILYVLQEKIKGNTLDKIKQDDLSIETLKKLDELIYLSLEMWEKTLNSNYKESYPLAIPKDFHETGVVVVQEGQGIMPEVVNIRNIMIGKRPDSKKAGVYYINTHSVMVFNASGLTGIGEYLDKFTSMAKKLTSSGYAPKSVELFRQLKTKYHS